MQAAAQENIPPEIITPVESPEKAEPPKAEVINLPASEEKVVDIAEAQIN